MRSADVALDYIRRASRTLGEARKAFDSMDHPLTMRRSQETLELSLKAVLTSLAIPVSMM